MIKDIELDNRSQILGHIHVLKRSETKIVVRANYLTRISFVLIVTARFQFSTSLIQQRKLVIVNVLKETSSLRME